MYKWFIEIDIKSDYVISEALSTSHDDAVITFSDDYNAHIELNQDEIPT
jgi:hypothetical protein